jgi:hypothetical protein
LVNKLQILTVAPCKEIDGKPVKSLQCLLWDAAKCKPGIGKSKKLNNLPGNNAHPNSWENPNSFHPKTQCFADVRENPDISRDILNCLITSWETNKPPPEQQ